MKRLIYLSICMILTSIGFCEYSIDWYTIDGGGGTMSGGKYALTGTIGQADAGYAWMDTYDLGGGFWPWGPECRVDLEFFADFAAHWLEGPCHAGNYWCDGADLNRVDDVNMDDLALLVNAWLQACPVGW